MIVDNHFTWQYNPEDSSEHHTRRRENLKSHTPVVLISRAEGKPHVKYILKYKLREREGDEQVSYKTLDPE
jgi:hypothetical protein